MCVCAVYESTPGDPYSKWVHAHYFLSVIHKPIGLADLTYISVNENGLARMTQLPTIPFNPLGAKGIFIC